MVSTRKFSQFPAGTLDVAVGLEAGANTQGPTGGGGGGAGVTETFPQPGTPLAIGQWVKAELGTGIYKPARGDIPLDAEAIGLVVEANAATFTLQQAGYVSTTKGVFAGLQVGTSYFLDTVTPGAMVPVDANIDNQISRPVFITDSPTSGWVAPYRPMIVGDSTQTGGTGPGIDTNVATINQNGHGFAVGNWIRVSTPPDLILDQPKYVLAVDDSLGDSQSIGVVTSVTTNQFTVQFAGFNTGAVTVDSALAPVVPSVVYYLSATPGFITATPPTQFSKPLFICEQTGAGGLSTGVYTGWILPQRPLDFNALNPGLHTVTVANAFNVGQWVYNKGPGNNTYDLAIATSLATSQVAGVVTQASGTQFTIQQVGWNVGSITKVAGVYPYIDGTPAAITPGQIFYLSTAIPGNISTTVPAVGGQVTKPCYVQESGATFTGQILPQRPLVVTGGGGGNVIQVVSGSNNAFVNVSNAPLPGIGGAITLSNAANRVKLTFTISYACNSVIAFFQFMRNGVPIPNVIFATDQQFGVGPLSAAYVYVDTPGIVGPITYTINVTGGFQLNAGAMSTWVFEEIG